MKVRVLDESLQCIRALPTGFTHFLSKAFELLRQSPIVFPIYDYPDGTEYMKIDWEYEGLCITVHFTEDDDVAQYILPYKNCVIELTDEEDAAFATVYKLRHIGFIHTGEIEHYFKVTGPQRVLLVPLPVELLAVIVGYLC